MRSCLAALVLAVLALLIRLTVGPLTIDDAYITFRYSRNIATGLGFVYNPGEHVLGTTTPLYALLLAGWYAVDFHDLSRVALVLNAVADSATVLMLVYVGRLLGLPSPWPLLAGGLFAIAPASVNFATAGMETSVFIALVFGAAIADASRRPSLAAFLAGLATLTRPEGLLMAALILGRHVLQLRWPPLRPGLIFAATVLPWYTFAQLYFGLPWSQSVVAKAVSYDVGSLANVLSTARTVGIPLLWALLTLPLVPAALRHLRKHGECWPLAAFAPLLIAGYTVVAFVPMRIFHWYFMPALPFALLGAGLALQRATAKLRAPLPLLVVLTVALSVLFGLNLWRDARYSPLEPLGVRPMREEAFLAAVEFLRPRLGPETLVALPEFGAFGYATESRILDTVGLVSPQATRYYPLPAEFSHPRAMPPGLIQRERPDYLVGLDQYFDPLLVDAGWFQHDYRLLTSFDMPIWVSRVVLVYERVGD